MIKKLSKICFIMIIWITVSGFGFKFKAVSYNRFFTGVETAYDNVFQICFDRSGAVYPQPQGDYLITPDRQRTFENYHFGKVEDYFRKGRISENYSDIEPDVLKNYVRVIRDKVLSEPQCRVIFLIHDFNNTYPEAQKNYDKCRNLIDGSSIQKNIYIQIYWDGLRGILTGMNPKLKTYWNQACHNSVTVGSYGVRRILNSLYVDEIKNRPVVMISHGRGAAVIASTLWDYTSPDTNRPVQPIEFHFARFDVGMIAPSLSKRSFDSFNPDPKYQFVIGLNRDDPINRAFGEMPPGYFGATDFGYSAAIFKEIREKMDGTMTMVPFIVSRRQFQSYLKTKEKIFERNFLPLLFNHQH